MSEQIVPRRAVHLKPGMVVKPTRETAYRILSIEEQPNSIYLVGTWEDLTDAQRQPFRLVFCRWLTTIQQEHTAS